MSDRVTTLERLSDFVAALNAAEIDYLLVGSIAGNLYGEPRSTKDADFVAQTDPEAIRRLVRALPDDIAVDLQTSFELRTVTTRRLKARLPSKFEVELFDVGDDPHHVERFQRRVLKTLRSLGCDAWVATGEDMLIQKLRWQRPKDIEDAVDYVAVSGVRFDWDYVQRWTDEHGTTRLLNDVKRQAEDLQADT